MAPIGFDMSDDLDNLTQQPTPETVATILVISCQQAAQDGTYQTLVESLSNQGKVEMHMFDRIVEGATELPSSQYEHISLLLPSTLITSSLLSMIEPSLVPGGILKVHGEEAASSESVTQDLKSIPNLTGVSVDQKDSNTLTCSKVIVSLENPSSSADNGSIDPSAPVSLKRPAANDDEVPAASTSAPASAIALPLRSSRAAKASLWAFTSGTATPTIDESTLLTAEDLERPSLVKREDCDVKKTRKACKNCSCGLRELLIQEKDDLGAVGFKEGQVGNGAIGGDGVQGLGANVTSSCGSCYLGDAFRCASCPYLGMPAFEPGQKVSMSGHDDKVIS